MRSGALLLAGLVAWAGEVRATDPPDLSGRWKLNVGESDDPSEKMREAFKGLQGGGWGPGPGGGMGAPLGPMGRPQGGYGRPASDPVEAVRSRLQAPGEMEVTQTPPEIVVVEKYGRRRLLHPDGKKYKLEEGRLQVRARWDGSNLIVETRTDDAAKVTETIGLSAEGRKLRVDLTLVTPMTREVKVRRVYDRVEEEEPAPVP